MFADRHTISLMTIHDDRAGAATDLAFPNMSTCAAIICVLDDRLVGIHKIQGPISGRALKLFKYARELLGDDTVHRIVILGWNVGTGAQHAPADIATALNRPNAPKSLFDFSTTTNRRGHMAFQTGRFKGKMIDLCTFAAHNGNGFPRITVKRTKKVTNQNVAFGTLSQDNPPDGAVAQFGSVAEAVTSSNDHAISQDRFTHI